ncbi:dirigent protein 20-like isoform X2 [Papaver somniferum]|uniref:dirigent protein 20-like isoform X2 n=1 Tax=Papaver somniferum TaxID=3469 RepID=UPI000E6FDE44|nr:dirigent protein 20-like isoform X2 [Papaver somniferum]
MAKIHSKSALSLATLSLLFAILCINCIIVAVDGELQTFGRVLNPTDLGPKKEKLSHFLMYRHDIVSGPNPTAIEVASASTTRNSSTFFGGVVMMDDPLTEGPELSSKLIGRAQGFYASAGINELAMLVNMNFAFMVGEYNGSTISIMGRDALLSEKVQEMPIVGGAGLFRFARGYVQVRTQKVNVTSGVVFEEEMNNQIQLCFGDDNLIPELGSLRIHLFTRLVRDHKRTKW